MFKGNFYRFCLLIFGLFYLAPCGAQPKMATVTGQVRDEKSLPVPGASVFIENLGKGAVTNGEGIYEITMVGKNNIVLQVQALGYEAQYKSISLKPGTTLKLDFTLSEKNYELGEVGVVAKSEAQELRETAYSVNVLEAKKYKNLTTDINQVLMGTSGINIRQAGGVGSGFKLSLNGLSGNQIRYFIDGIPMENFGSSLSLNNFPVNLIENIEVYKGVVPVSLGADALGGAINITTSYRGKSFLDVAYSAGSFNTHKASFNGQYANKTKGYFLRVSSFFNHSDNNYEMKNVPLYDLELGNYLGETSQKRFHSEYTSGMAKLEAGIFDKKLADRLTLSVTQSLNHKNYQHPDNNIKRVYGAFYTENSTLLGSVTYAKQFGKLKVNGYFLGGKIKETVVDTGSYKFNWAGDFIPRPESYEGGELYERKSLLIINDRVMSGSLSTEYDFSENHFLAVNYSQNYLSRSGEDLVNELNTSFEFPSYISKNVLGFGYTFISDSKRWEANLFGKEYWFAGKIITHDYLDNKLEKKPGLSNTGYGFAITYWVNEKLQLKTSFEKAFRMPESFEILGDGIYVSSNPELMPEKSYNANFNVHYKQKFGDLNFRSEGNLFLRSSRDFIRFKPLGPFGQYENLNNVLTTGAEAGFELAYRNLITFNANATYQNLTDRTLEDEGLPNVNYRSKIPNVPFLFGNARVGIKPFQKLKNSDFSVYWSTHYVHEFFLSWENLGSADSKHIIPEQLTHDLELAYALRQGRYNLSVTFSNITDAEVYDNYRIQKPGRAIYFKIRYLLK